MNDIKLKAKIYNLYYYAVYIYIENNIADIKKIQEDNMPRGKNRGACGGTPRKDGSGGGKGNRGTSRQPKKKK